MVTHARMTLVSGVDPGGTEPQTTRLSAVVTIAAALKLGPRVRFRDLQTPVRSDYAQPRCRKQHY